MTIGRNGIGVLALSLASVGGLGATTLAQDPAPDPLTIRFGQLPSLDHAPSGWRSPPPSATRWQPS